MIHEAKNIAISLVVIAICIVCCILIVSFIGGDFIVENLTSSVYELLGCNIEGIGFVFSSQNSSPELRPKDDSVVDWVELHYYNLSDGAQFPLDTNGDPVLMLVHEDSFGQYVWDPELGGRVWKNDANGTGLQTLALTGVVMYPNDQASLAGNKAYYNISGAFLVSNTWMPISGSSVYNQHFNPKMSPNVITPNLEQDITCQFLLVNKDRSYTTLSCDGASYMETANYLAIGPTDLVDEGFLMQACPDGMQIIKIKDAISELNRLKNESTDVPLWEKIARDMQKLKLFVEPMIAPATP